MWWGVLANSGENSDRSAFFCILISVISGSNDWCITVSAKADGKPISFAGHIIATCSHIVA